MTTARQRKLAAEKRKMEAETEAQKKYTEAKEPETEQVPATPTKPTVLTTTKTGHINTSTKKRRSIEISVDSGSPTPTKSNTTKNSFNKPNNQFNQLQDDDDSTKKRLLHLDIRT